MIRWVVGGDVREVFQQETAESQRDVLLVLLEPCCGLCYPAAERGPWKTPSSMTHTLVTCDL